MRLPRSIHRRALGHTLMEVVVAMVAGTVLMGGLASVMFISRQVAYTPTASVQRIEAARAISDINDELRYATLLIQRGPRAIEFVVADRDGDNRAERIRYHWGPKDPLARPPQPGDSLWKTFNGGEATSVVPSVENFLLDYTVEDEVATLETTTDNGETVIAKYDAAGSNRDRAIGASGSINPWVAQRIDLAAVPAGALSWNATRVIFTADPSSSADETLRVELRLSGDNSPTSHVLTAIDIAEATLSGSQSFDLPIRGLSLSRKHALVWANYGSAEAAKLYYNDADQPTTSVLESTNGGASWRFVEDQQVYYQLLGTYSMPGPTYNLTRKFIPRVRVTLQADPATHARVEAGIQLVNRPELLSAYWRADFAGDPPNDPPVAIDPTAADHNADGTNDWELVAATFDVTTLSNGIWTVDGQLESRPANDFTGVTIVEARCRGGATLRINADQQSGVHAPLIVRVRPQGNAQRLTLEGESAPGVTKPLCHVADLSGDLNDDSSLIQFRLTILPAQDLVNLQINGEDQGTFTYPTYGPASADRAVSLSGTGAHFDYVEVRVTDDAAVEQL